jgi:hypothetical protein
VVKHARERGRADELGLSAYGLPPFLGKAVGAPAEKPAKSASTMCHYGTIIDNVKVKLKCSF